MRIVRNGDHEDYALATMLDIQQGILEQLTLIAENLSVMVAVLRKEP